MMEETMEQHQSIVERYLAIWNEVDAAQRQDQIARTWADDAYYIDPLMEGDGHAGINALVQAVQQQFPDFRFRQLGAVDGHHSYVRFSWELGPEGEPAPIAGSDVATLSPDGRLQRVVGFLDRVPGSVSQA
jgi:hypothetical protein